MWLDKAVKGIIDPDAEHLPFKKMDPNKTETGVLHNFVIDPKIYYAGCPAPRKIIADTGAAVDLIGSRDLHHKDKQKKTPEPIHFSTANGHTKADTIVQYYSPALDENISPHVLSDSVSAISIGKRVANGCEFHWLPPKIIKRDHANCSNPTAKRLSLRSTSMTFHI